MTETEGEQLLPGSAAELKRCYDLLRRLTQRAISEEQSIYFHVLSAASSIVHETWLATRRIDEEQARRRAGKD